MLIINVHMIDLESSVRLLSSASSFFGSEVKIVLIASKAIIVIILKIT